MQTLTHIFTIYCIIFLLWMCFRWTTKSFANSMVKVSLFLISLLGIIIELKSFNII